MPDDVVKRSEALIHLALEEDLNKIGDITSDAFLKQGRSGEAFIVAKQPGVLAGLRVAEAVFKKVNPAVNFKEELQDGARLGTSDKVARITGPLTDILKAERIALNFLQRLSGIATLTSLFVERIKGTRAKILDTRKTTPGLRNLEKYAVRVGGGHNHRFGLFDMVLIKENHIALAGGIRNAIEQTRAYVLGKGGTAPIEVEVKNLQEAREALEYNIDRLLLDNMSVELVQTVVEQTNGKTQLEVSGGVSLESIREFAETGVDYISVGALTHSARALDLSLLVNN